jgi:hypothetical protein
LARHFRLLAGLVELRSTRWVGSTTARHPLLLPATDIAADVGLPANELPGRKFTAVWDGEVFRPVDDPRL